MAFLDNDGLTYLWSKVKSYVSSKTRPSVGVYCGWCLDNHNVEIKTLNIGSYSEAVENTADIKLKNGDIIVISFNNGNTSSKLKIKFNGEIFPVKVDSNHLSQLKVPSWSRSKPTAFVVAAATMEGYTHELRMLFNPITGIEKVDGATSTNGELMRCVACTSAQSVTEKEITVPWIKSKTDLEIGTLLLVRFTNSHNLNTAPHLIVNGEDHGTIKTNTTTNSLADVVSTTSWGFNSYVWLAWNGANWQIASAPNTIAAYARKGISNITTSLTSTATSGTSVAPKALNDLYKFSVLTGRYYVSCNTPKDEPAKTVTIPIAGTTKFTFTENVFLDVTFLYGITGGDNLTLNVNDTGAVRFICPYDFPAGSHITIGSGSNFWNVVNGPYPPDKILEVLTDGELP